MNLTENQLTAHDNAVRKHIRLVRKNGKILIHELLERLSIHDSSKLQEPERSIYAEHIDKLKLTVYGSPEYSDLLEKVKPALDSHYAQNRHHPEHWPKGIDDMDLVDILEMLSDWAASVKKNKNGNIHRSIEINAKRFNMSPQLAQILTNTVERYF